MNRHERRSLEVKARNGTMDSHQADIAQRLDVAKRQQQVWSEVLTTYLKAMMLLTEGVRGTLAGLGMSERDILTNIDQVLGKMRDESAAHVKRATANGAGEEARQ